MLAMTPRARESANSLCCRTETRILCFLVWIIYVLLLFSLFTNGHCGYKVKLYLCFTRRQSQWPRALESWVCGHLLAGFAGLNPARGMNVCCLCVLCVVR